MKNFILAFLVISTLTYGSQTLAASLDCSEYYDKNCIESIVAALEYGSDLNGAFEILEYENINRIKNNEIKAFVSKMKTYVEKNINLEVDASAVSTVGNMLISATVVLSTDRKILGGSISYYQEGAQNPSQRGSDIVSLHFKNRYEANRAKYSVRTGWSFVGMFDQSLNKIGWWDPENRISFEGY